MAQNFNFNFDLPSFGIGFGAGIVASAAGYRAWKFVSKFGADEGEKAVVRTAAHHYVDRGYLRALVEYAQYSHLMGHKSLRLTEMLIEPHFLPQPELINMPDEDAEVTRNIWDSLPRIHDYPYLHAPYNAPDFSIEHLGQGTNKLILVGIPGSGRTTALLTIALWSAGFVEFKQPDDAVSRQIAESEAELSSKEKAERIKKRVALVERAHQQQTAMHGDQGVEAEKASAAAGARFRSLAPLYIHLSNVLPASGEYGRRIDPAEPLMRGLQTTTGYVASRRMVGKTYKLLEAGQALVLIDGFDDIPYSDRPAMMVWLQQFMELYGSNFIIVAMPPEGYHPLVQAGAVPIFLRPWNDQRHSDTTANFIDRWGSISDNPIHFNAEQYRKPEDFYADLNRQTRLMTPFDTVLHTYSHMNGETGNESAQAAAYLRTLLPEADEIQTDLHRLAALQLDEGYITQRRLVNLAMKYETGTSTSRASARPPLPTTDDNQPAAQVQPVQSESSVSDGAYDEFFGHLDSDSGSLSTVQAVETRSPLSTTSQEISSDIMPETDKRASKQMRQIASEQAKLLKKLLRTGILVQYRGGRYQFRHHFLAAYLAASSIAESDTTTLLQKHADADWRYAMRYLAQQRDVDVLVAQQIASGEIDILHNRVLELTTWLRFAGPDVAWRSLLLKFLGNLLVAPNQYTLVRERVAAALLGARDEGTLVVFSRALKNNNPDIRKLACLAVGALGAEDAANLLAQLAIEDPDVDSRICAALALTALKSQISLETMVDVLEMHDDRDVRRAITESLAADREQGYLLLTELLKSNDIMLRRAGAFGLGRVPTDWALIMLNEVFLEDKESYVRLAAEAVLSDIRKANMQGIHAYPNIAEVPWLTSWAQLQIDYGNLPHDAEGMPVFDAAFEQTEQPIIRLLATVTIGQIGLVSRLSDMYKALRDQQEAIRDAAYRGLGDFQQKLGKDLPVPC